MWETGVRNHLCFIYYAVSYCHVVKARESNPFPYWDWCSLSFFQKKKNVDCRFEQCIAELWCGLFVIHMQPEFYRERNEFDLNQLALPNIIYLGFLSATKFECRRSWEIIQLIICLSCKREVLNSTPRAHIKMRTRQHALVIPQWRGRDRWFLGLTGQPT